MMESQPSWKGKQKMQYARYLRHVAAKLANRGMYTKAREFMAIADKFEMRESV